MSGKRIYVFNGPVNGQLSLTDCEVVINDRAGQVIVNGGRLINQGTIGMTIHGQGSVHVQGTGGVHEKIVYRDRIVEKPVIKHVYSDSPETLNEIKKLKAQVKNLKALNRELQNGIDTETIRERDDYRYRLQLCQKENVSLRNSVARLEDSIEAFKEVNRNQAERIGELEKEKTVVTEHDEYEPSRKDLKMISRNIHLFLDDRKREYEDLMEQ